jgi:hypothetical protein
VAITRLSGGLTPADGADPRTFPAVWNGTADDLEAGEYSKVPSGGSAGEVLVKQSATDYDSAWAFPQWSWQPTSGSYYGAVITGTASTVLLARRTYCVPMFFPKPTAVDRVNMRITGAGGAGSVIRFGIYGGTEFPTDLLHDFGTVDGTVTGLSIELTVSATLTGFFWLAARASDVTPGPTVIGANGGGQLWMPRTNVVGASLSGFITFTEADTSDALPDPYPVTNTNPTNTGPIMSLRAA